MDRPSSAIGLWGATSGLATPPWQVRICPSVLPERIRATRHGRRRRAERIDGTMARALLERCDAEAAAG